MIYPYQCLECQRHFEVIKSVRYIDAPEHCECGSIAKRYIGKTHFYGASDWWTGTHYNPAFGKLIRSKAHMNEEVMLARREGKDLIEVGNESVHKINAAADKRRDDRAAERWREASRELGISE